jgi:phosphatidylglycerophosphatase A
VDPERQRPSGFLDRAAFVLATWFGCGLSPVAPGTVGTLGALPLYLWIGPHGPWAVGLAALLVTVVGVAASGRVARHRGLKDPQVVCIDEVAGVLVALTAARFEPGQAAVAVVLFRVFDIAKPWPVRLIDRRVPGGWGIVGDDVAAGLLAALPVVAWRLAHAWM